MTQTAAFWGASDDLIEVEGVKGGDEFGAVYKEGSAAVGSFILGGKMRITAHYAGCWGFAIWPVDEDVLLPDWPVRVCLAGNGYSTRLEIDVPDDVAVFREHQA